MSFAGAWIGFYDKKIGSVAAVSSFCTKISKPAAWYESCINIVI